MEKTPTLLTWLGFEAQPDFSRAKPLGKVFGFLCIFFVFEFVVVITLCLVFVLGALTGFGPFSGDPTGSAVRNLGLVLAAAFGAPFLVWRAIVAQKQVDVAEQDQITDRMNKAVEGLGAVRSHVDILKIPRFQRKSDGEWLMDEDGKPAPELDAAGSPMWGFENYESTKPNLEVRIGAIYALERIARDSLRDHLHIMEILCAYVRENSRSKDLIPREPPFFELPRTDIQAAISVISRRSHEQKEIEFHNRFWLDFVYSDLSFIDFGAGEFSAAKFHKCRLEGEKFDECVLTGTQFFGSLMNFSTFNDATLRGTRFDHAVFNRPLNRQAFAPSFMLGNVDAITVIGANLSAVSYLGDNRDIKKIFGSKDTVLNYELESIREQSSGELISRLRNYESILEERDEVDFSHWFPYESNDLAVGNFFKKFMEGRGLVGWPHFSSGASRPSRPD